MIEVKQATFLDHAAVWWLRLEILKECPEVLESLTGRCVAVMCHQVNGWLLDRDMAVFVAYDGVLPVGLAVLGLGAVAASGSESAATIHNLWVKPEYRTTVAGHMLLKRLYATVMALAPVKLQVVTRNDYHELSKFMTNHGFKNAFSIFEKTYGEG